MFNSFEIALAQKRAADKLEAMSLLLDQVQPEHRLAVAEAAKQLHEAGMAHDAIEAVDSEVHTYLRMGGDRWYREVILDNEEIVSC